MKTPKIAAAVGAALAAVALAACGSSGSSSQTTATPAGKDPKSAQLDAPATLTPTKPAPDFTLRNSHGRPVTLSQFHGKAVLLTFIYSHCPDVCPLIVSNLHNALSTMSPQDASKAQVVAVSVDPRGDTPKAVNSFIRAHEMTGKMQYLIGTKKELAPVWKKWGVAVQATPDAREVDHSAFVYGITGSGQVEALYPSNMKPAWIVHDVPLLAAR